MNRFERLHALLSQKPRANLGFFPTPLYKLDRLSERLGVNLYVKRDDFSGMSLFGGNKIRRLIAQSRRSGFRAIPRRPPAPPRRAASAP